MRLSFLLSLVFYFILGKVANSGKEIMLTFSNLSISSQLKIIIQILKIEMIVLKF